MEWYKHRTGSHDDPDISDAWDELGDFGYVGFFVILEIYGQEFRHRNSEDFIEISVTFLRRKLRKSLGKVTLLLNFFQKRQRILSIIEGDRILIKIPDFMGLMDNWSRRQLCSSSVVAPFPSREQEEDKEEEVITTTVTNTSVSEASTAKDYLSVDYQRNLKQAKQVIDYLNTKAGKNFPSDPHLYFGVNKIIDRLSEGKTVEQCKIIIDKKTRDPDFKKRHLVPETLFKQELFDKYLYEDENEYSDNGKRKEKPAKQPKPKIHGTRPKITC